MGGGGSVSAPNIPLRNPKQEQGTLGNWLNWQQNQLGSYIQNNPLQQTANTGALNFYGGTSGLTSPLQSLLGSIPGQYGDIQSQLGGISGQLGGLAASVPSLFQGPEGRLSGVAGRYGALESQMPRIGGLTNPLMGLFNRNVAAARGPLTSGEERDVSQRSRAIASAMGAAQSPGALGTELLNREQYQQQRQGFYQGLANQGAGTIEGLRAQDAATRGGLLSGETGALSQLDALRQGRLGLQGNLLGQQSGIGALQGSLLGQQASTTGGLASGIQGLQTGALNQLLGTQGSNVSGFTGLESGPLQYLSNLFSNNEQARIDQAQIQTQAGLANQSAGAGKSSGLISAGGSIIGAAALAL